MTFEGIFSIISEIKKKIIYIVLFRSRSAIIFFIYGKVIKKIETDMFWGLNIPDKPDASKQLLEISQNIASISNRLVIIIP